MYGYERLTKRLAPMSKPICEKSEMNASPTDYRSVTPVEQQRADLYGIQIAPRVPHKVGEEESCCFSPIFFSSRMNLSLFRSLHRSSFTKLSKYLPTRRSNLLMRPGQSDRMVTK